MASAAWMVTGSASRREGTKESTMTSVSESMKTSFTNTSALFALPLGVSMKWPCTSKMNSSFAGSSCTRASGSSSAASLEISKTPPTRPAAAFAALNERRVAAAPQEESRKLLLERPSFLEKTEADSCARRLASRLAGQSGTGANSPLEVESSLIGRRLPSGSMPCFMAGLLCKRGTPPSGHEAAAVHVDGLAGDVARVGPAQHAHDRGDLLGLAAAADRRHAAPVARSKRRARQTAHGLDGPGHHAVDRDAARREVERERTRHAGDAGLGGYDVGAAGCALVRGEASDIHDRPAAHPDEMGQAGLGAQERAVEHRRDDVTPFLELDVLERRLAPHGGIVDQDVEPSELLDRRVHHLRDRVGVGHVGEVESGRAADRLDHRHGALGVALRGIGV